MSTNSIPSSYLLTKQKLLDPASNDSMGRKPYVDYFIKMVEKLQTPSVISINGPWGSGKTFFLKYLESELNKEHYTVIYHSAWEADYSSDPLISLLINLKRHIRQNVKFTPDLKIKFNHKFNLLMSSAVKLSKELPHITTSAVTLGAVTSDDTKKILSTLASVFSEQLSDNDIHLDDFRETAAQLFDLFDLRDNKLVIIIDELDRCKPTYAISLLEKVKHVFNIEGIIFFVGLEQNELAQSVRALYGQSFSADRYLKRFFDFEFQLPKSTTREFIKQQIIEHGLYEFYCNSDIWETSYRYSGSSLTHFYEVIEAFSALFKELELRDIESVIRRLNVMRFSIYENDELDPLLTLTLLLTYRYDLKLYSMVMKTGSVEPNFISEISLVKKKLSSAGRQNLHYICSVIEGLYLIRKDDADIHLTNSIPRNGTQTDKDLYSFKSFVYRNSESFLNTFEKVFSATEQFK